MVLLGSSCLNGFFLSWLSRKIYFSYSSPDSLEPGPPCPTPSCSFSRSFLFHFPNVQNTKGGDAASVYRRSAAVSTQPRTSRNVKKYQGKFFGERVFSHANLSEAEVIGLRETSFHHKLCFDGFHLELTWVRNSFRGNIIQLFSVFVRLQQSPTDISWLTCSSNRSTISHGRMTTVLDQWSYRSLEATQVSSAECGHFWSRFSGFTLSCGWCEKTPSGCDGNQQSLVHAYKRIQRISLVVSQREE